MANAPPGSSSYLGNSNGSLKRPLSDGEGSTGSHKRQRERERDREPRDWRDVHLNRGGGGGGGGQAERRGRRTPPPPLAEKEEGEISPRPRSVSLATPPPTTPTPVPTPMEVEPERELDLVPSPPPVEQTLAERRARRAAILARHASSAPNSNPGSTGPLNGILFLSPPTIYSINHAGASPSVSTPAEANVNGSTATSAQNGHGPSTPAKQPLSLALTLAGARAGTVHAGQTRFSWKDIDCTESARTSFDEFKDKEPHRPRLRFLSTSRDEEEEEEEEDEVDDMFAFAGPKTKKTGKKKAKTAKAPASAQQQQHVLHSDTAADPEGYYTVILGEILVAPPTANNEKGERYQVYASVGRGMFAVVVRARVLPEGEDGKESKEGGREVAIKIVRAQEVMHRAGLKESAILQKLQAADPEDKKHIVRLERTFEHRGHLCLVFESMSMNLRDVVKRFGKDVGLNIRAVRAYAHQLFISLGHLRKLGVMHADIKPDNILVNDAKTMLKLCDLGSASDAAENEITPYLVSRFYRAPEIILGVPYDPALDVWSVGCTLYELYTGKILFPGRSNNQMLLHMMELKGRFNGKMIKRAKFGDVYFDEMGGFESVEREKGSGNDVIRKVHISKPARDLRARLLPSGGARLSDEETNVLLHFVDLLDKCLSLDPARRITPREALAHPFIRGSTK
ncbi:Serine/threonine protein kinase PRP4 [Mycena venus]|uniref:non-specific serine/threonine protein kinase n=1 Tax=Mycena venus TaxID=2733690 RepID=A0A8H6Y823_9AGAR|nr:Serine/threonine protein kinase PRP4 [Mycena venus]